MELLKVTKDIAIRSLCHGACRIIKIGSLASDYSVNELTWAERLFSLKELKAFKFPLWTWSGYGSGSGSGYGSGYVDGYGSGYVDGSGSGSGYGDGNGDGSGSGSGYADGSGYGDGDGDGSGYGYGGYGYGSKYGSEGDGYGADIGEKILALNDEGEPKENRGC